MRRKKHFVHRTMYLLLALFLLYGMDGCKHRAAVAKGHQGSDPSGGCSIHIDNDGLYNCVKDKCAHKCTMQWKKPGAPWKDIPGGNLNPNDVGDDDSVRCVCDTAGTHKL